MSQEQVLKTLVGLGLTRLDSEVYIYLAKKGPQKGQEITKGLKIQKQQIYRSLKNLENKGIVSITLEHPARFTAVSFEKVVDLFVKEKIDEAQRIQENKQEILANWQAINIKESIDTIPKFNIIEGRGHIYSKILQMIKETKNQLSTISTVTGLVRADQFGLFDVGSNQSLKAKIRFRFLTDVTEQNISALKSLLSEMTNIKSSFEGRIPNLGLNLFPQMVIKDDEEAVFFIGLKPGKPLTEDDIGLWTNCRPLVQAFTTVFEGLWYNSTDIQTKIAEIEACQALINPGVTSDTEAVLKKYNAVMGSAEEEVTTITSADGLIASWKNNQLLTELAKKGITIRIMAPITSKNMETAQKLQKYCEVKHIVTRNVGTTIIDGKHLFQFKNLTQSQSEAEPRTDFKDIFYTDDSEYIEKTNNMLNYVWKNAQSPSVITLDSIAGSTIASCSEHVVYQATKKMIGHTVMEDVEASKSLTEKSVIEKMLNARKNPPGAAPTGTVMIYSVNGQAIVHPPSQLDLPDILFHTYHIEKHSTYGAEDAMMVHLWLDTPAGYAFVPAAVVTDNPKSVGFWKKSCAKTPSGTNVQLVKKDEIEAYIHGNTLFVGWATQIPLLNNRYCIPPSCLLIEGYGSIKTNAYKATVPSGYTIKTEGNILEAFVTFLNPSSNYSGPGTDGAFGRDVILELFPPATKS